MKTLTISGLKCGRSGSNEILKDTSSFLGALLSLSGVNFKIWEEWHSGLRHYIRNWKDPSSNPTSCSTGLCDPTLLRISR